MGQLVTIELTRAQGFLDAGSLMELPAGVASEYVRRGVAKYVDAPLRAKQRKIIRPTQVHEA